MKKSSIHRASLGFDIFLLEGGVGASLFLVLVLLFFVNAHSLIFLFGHSWLSIGFSIIGSAGLSMTTTSVIRNPIKPWMRYVFPLYDTVLVALGLLAFQGIGLPVTEIMIGFFSTFIGLIIFSLGLINHEKNENQNQSAQNRNESEQKLIDLTVRLDESKKKLTESEQKLIESEQKLIDLTEQLNQSKLKQSEYYPNHIHWLAFGEKKKSKPNQKIIEESKKIKNEKSGIDKKKKS